MRTLFIVGLVLVVLALVTVPGLWMHAKQVPQDIANKVNSSVSDEHAVGLVEGDIKRVDVDLKDRYTKVYKAKVEMAKIQSAMNVQNDQLKKEEQIIKRSQEILNQGAPGSTVLVAGCKYDWDEINQEALNHLNTCKVLRKQIAGNEQSLSRLSQAYEAGVKAIAEKREELRRQKMDFEAEKVELAVLRAQESVNGVISEINQAGDINTNVSEARQLFNDRLNELKAKAEYDQQNSLSKPSTVPWDRELGLNEKAADQIGSYLKETNPSQPESEKK